MGKQIGLGVILVIDMTKNVQASKRFLLSGLFFVLIFFLCINSISAFSNSAVSEAIKYCELDFNGARIPGGNYKEIRDLMAWDEGRDEPGWDCFIIVSGYEINNEEIKQNTAKVTIEYNVLSQFCGDYSLEKKSYVDRVDFNLVKISDFCEINEYVLYPRISKKVALDYLKKRSAILKEYREEVNKINLLIDALGK